MQEYIGIVILVGIGFLGFLGKPIPENLSHTNRKIIAQNAVPSNLKDKVKYPQKETNSIRGTQIAKVVLDAKSLSEARKEIENNYDEIKTSFVQQNPTVYLRYLTTDFVTTSRRGQIANLNQIREIHQTLLKQTKFAQVTIEVLKFDVNSNLGTVSVLANKKANGLMSNHKIETDSTTQDLWVRSKQSWQLRKSENISQKITLDGIRMPTD